MQKFEEQVNAAAKAHVGRKDVAGAEVGAGTAAGASFEERRELRERYQHIVNQTQLPRLNKMIRVLDENILDSDQHFTYVVIDDLDRDWVDDRLLNDLIRSLFRTVLDLQRLSRLKILVALRTNIFSQLDFGRAGGQEEKFRGLVLPMKWARNELIALLDERARVAAEERGIENVEGIADLLPRANKARGNALNFILDRTLLRPRDAMAYLNECFTNTSGKPHISWDIILAAEGPYSYGRLLALRDEWKLTYPGIADVFAHFERERMPMSRETFIRHLDDIMELLADNEFAGSTWLTRVSETMWDAGQYEWQQLYHPLTEVLFRIGLIGFSRSPGDAIVYAHDDMDFGSRSTNLRDDSLFCVHPTFHAALEITHR